MAKLLELDARTPIARNTSRVAYLLILSVCGRAAKRTFPTPPKNKLALPVGSRALSHRFAPTKHRNARNEDRQIPELFYSLLPLLSLIFSLVHLFRIAHFCIERNRDSERDSGWHRRSNTLHPAVLTKIESSLSFPLEIDPPRSTFAECSHETGSTGRSNKGVHGLRTNLSRLAEYCDERRESNESCKFSQTFMDHLNSLGTISFSPLSLFLRSPCNFERAAGNGRRTIAMQFPTREIRNNSPCKVYGRSVKLQVARSGERTLDFQSNFIGR